MIKDFFRVLLFPLNDVITLRINRKWALSSKVLISTYVFLGNDECANVSVSCKFFCISQNLMSVLVQISTPAIRPVRTRLVASVVSAIKATFPGMKAESVKVLFTFLKVDFCWLAW